MSGLRLNAHRTITAHYPSLGNSDFSKLLVANVITTVGFWLSRIAAYELFVFETNIGPFQVGLFGVVITAPQLLGGPIAGVINDRYDRQSLIVGSYLVCVPVVLALVFVPSFPIALLVFLVSGSMYTISRPAYRALIPQIVGDDVVSEANGLLSTADSFAQILGPAFAGMLLLFASPRVLFALDASTYLFAAGAVVLMGAYHTDFENEGFLTDLKMGLEQFRVAPKIALVSAGGALLFVSIGFFEAMNPYYIRETFGAASSLYSVQLVMIGAGTLVGGLAVGKLTAVSSDEPLILAASLLFGVSFLVFATVPLKSVAVIASGLLGMCVTLYMATAYGILSAETNEDVYGRVVGLFKTATRGGQLLAVSSAGLLTQLVGVRVLFRSSAILLVALTVLGTLFLQTRN